MTHQRIADGVEGVFAMPPTDRLDEQILESAPRLRAVTGFGVGFDYIDVDAATRHGVAVTNTAGRAGGHDGRAGVRADAGGGAAVVGGGIATSGPGSGASMSRGLLWGRDLFGSTLGIVGMGAIGQAVTRRAVAFGWT